jgi:hypothetical protein
MSSFHSGSGEVHRMQVPSSLDTTTTGTQTDLTRSIVQANYINALAVSVSPFFEPAKVTLGGLIFSPWVDFFMTLGGFFFGIR